MFIFLLALMQIGINDYKAKLKDIEISNNLEILKARQFDRYTPYSVYGVRLNCMPSPMNFLLTFKIYGGLSAAVDTGTKLKIYEDKKGNHLFPDLSFGYFNFSGFLLLFGSLISLIYGFEATSKKEFLEFLCSLKSFKKVFFKTLFSRMFFVSFFILLLLLSMVILAYINGINIIETNYFYFGLLGIIVMNFFLSIGTSLGSLKQKKTGKILLIGIFILLNFFAPWMINKIVINFSNGVSEHQIEYDKLKTLMAFEKRSVKEFGNVRSGEKVNEFMRSYLENELKLLEEMEGKHKRKLSEKIEKYKALSILFPSTFYLSSANEISSYGFNNYILFYGFSEKMKRGFIEFYFQKEYFTKPERGKVESFVKGDNNILYSKSSLPGNFSTGIWLTLFYIAGLGFITYFNTYKKLYPVKQKLEFEDDLYINIVKGQLNILFTGLELLKSKLYNHFSKKEKLKSEINFVSNGDNDIPGKIDFIYLPDTKNMEDISPNTLYKFLFGEKLQKNMERWEILFKYALNKRLIILDEFFRGLNPENIADMKLQLKEKDVFNLVISSDYYLTKEISDNVKKIYYLKNDTTASVLKNNI